MVLTGYNSCFVDVLCEWTWALKTLKDFTNMTMLFTSFFTMSVASLLDL